MKHHAILLNTSRGAVVETDALKSALLDNHLAAAVLDVWRESQLSMLRCLILLR